MNRTCKGIAILALVLAGAGCRDGCDPTGIGAAEPVIGSQQEELDFGLVRVGLSSTLNLVVFNEGQAVLDLDNIEVAEGPYRDWFTVSPRQERVGIGGNRQIQVSFVPLDAEEAEARLLLHSNDPDTPTKEVVLRGAGFIPTVEVTPLALDFGNVVVQSERTLAVSLTNNGDEPAQVQVRDVTGQGSGSYRVQLPAGASNNRFTLMPGESSEIDLTYAPTVTGRHLAAFTIEACDGCLPANVELSGIGIDSGLVVTPAAIDFAAVNPGTSVARPVTFRNIGNQEVSITSLAIVSLSGGAPSRAYSVEDVELPFVLEEGDEVEVDVVFAPTDLQTHIAGLEWTSTDSRNASGRIPLSGRGGGPDIDLVPRTVNFGLVAVGAPMRRGITVVNQGFEDLVVTGVDVADGDDVFRVVDFFGPVVLGIGEVLRVDLEFDPQADGVREGQLVVHSNDPDEPQAYATLIGEALDLPPCDFTVRPGEMRFGIVDRNQSRTQQFAITNEGNTGDLCLISGLRFTSNTSDAFEMPGDELGDIILEAGETARVDVTFAPTRHGTFTGAVEFYVSDPAEPQRQVSLHGVSQQAGVLIGPDEIDFGVVEVGCASREREFCVYNTGSSSITVTGVTVTVAGPDDDAFGVKSVPPGLASGGVTVQPGGRVCLGVEFRPMEFGRQTATFQVYVDGFSEPFVVIAEGVGAADAVQTDLFDQLEQPMADILFVIDDSCSMNPYQQNLGQNLEAFMEFAIDQHIDYQIGVITTDARDSHGGGMLRPLDGSRPQIITPRLPDPIGVFRQNVAVGISGDAIERGFWSAEKALTDPILNDQNAGFVRPDAHLALIFISDEPEQSANSVDYYLNIFQSVKGFRRPELFTASSIVSTQAGCAIGGPHHRYMEIANRTGGVISSICSNNWQDDLRDLSSVAFGFKSRFILTNQPVPGTIEVVIYRGGEDPVDGQGWTYDAENNAVHFEPLAVPESGDVVEVTYEVQCI